MMDERTHAYITLHLSYTVVPPGGLVSYLSRHVDPSGGQHPGSPHDADSAFRIQDAAFTAG
eukprot:gene20067-26785_t